MSVLCSLTQISPYLLNIIQAMPSVFELFWSVESIDSEDIIDNIYGLSSKYPHLLREILPEPEQAIGIFTLWDIKEIENWRVEYTEDFQLIKSEIYQIVIEGKTTPRLDLGKSWDAVGYIFRASFDYKDKSFLIDETTTKEVRVEVILGGKNLTDDVDIRYFESMKVQEIADSLSKFSNDTIQRRFQQMQSEQYNTYQYRWSKNGYEGLLSICNAVKDFCQDAAKRGNGILIDLG
jgi:Domain of unknown function (DUF1877)